MIEEAFILLLCAGKRNYTAEPSSSSNFCVSKYLIIQVPPCSNDEVNTP